VEKQMTYALAYQYLPALAQSSEQLPAAEQSAPMVAGVVTGEENES
jgi:hypothetical protein